MLVLVLVLMLVLVLKGPVWAAEPTTNGMGTGLWRAGTKRRVRDIMWIAWGIVCH